MKSNSLIILFAFIVVNIQAQTIYKPKGCSASVGPGVSTVVLQHPQDRYHLITMKWSDLEPSPGIFTFTTLQNQINTVKSYNKKYALAIASGGPGSPSWLIDSLNVPYINYLFQGNTPYKLPLWWDTIVQQRLSLMITALGNQFANDSSLALVYVTQMTVNGIEGHLNGINMTTMYSNGFSPTNWINAAKQTAYYYTTAFPDKAIAFEVHDVDGSSVIPSTIINDLYNDSTLCQRVGAAIWWLSGKTTYQPNLLTFLQSFSGDKYAQLIGKSNQPERFKDSSITTAFVQAKQLGIRYVEPWLYEYSNHTIDSLLLDFNNWSDSTFSSYYSCNLSLGLDELDELDELLESNIYKIYPNPANNIVHIDTGNEKIKSIRLYNINGENIKESFDNSFYISDLPNGIYFVKVITFKSTYMIKLIKQ